MFMPRDRVTVTKLNEMSPIDFALTEYAFKELLKHDGQKATVLWMETDGYYDIKFDDGYIVRAIDGYHLGKEIVGPTGNTGYDGIEIVGPTGEVG